MAEDEAPERITARVCRCSALVIGINACPHCGAGWAQTLVGPTKYVRERAAPDAPATDALEEVLEFPRTSDANTFAIARAQLAKLKATVSADAVRQAQREKTLTGCPCVETERSQCGTEACWHFTNKGICEMCANTGYLDLAVAQAELWDRINVILGGFGANIRKADLIEALQKERTG